MSAVRSLWCKIRIITNQPVDGLKHNYEEHEYIKSLEHSIVNNLLGVFHHGEDLHIHNYAI